ncbi:MAG: undecaprenyl-phosphate glucose phosphotransferase, partial [Nitrospinae bacterium]|nr:undecaprenyl-phosphate glucose phosphotransferase [Nitrospinota bacterium]
VGAGDLARRLVENFARHPESGMVVVGMLGDNHSEVGGEYLGVKVIGAVDELKEMIRRHGIDQIFIALPRHAHDRLEKTLLMLDDEVVDVKLAADIMEFMRLNPSVEDFDGIPIVSLTESPLYGWSAALKRMFDIIGSLALIVLTAPVMAAVALAIRLESRGPVIFRQQRVSLGGEPFTIYKFRSMRVDAEAHTGAVWATQNDPRRTRVGEFIRATSLDELPQFFNVLAGGMSLVGPRPERPVFVEDFKGGIPRYMLRHKVKAGITGWAQVNGWRGDTSLEKRIEFDLYYIENWSLLFDVKILWLTLWRGFINRNAY